jgi:hypothetical protein
MFLGKKIAVYCYKRRVRCAVYVARVGERVGACRILLGETYGIETTRKT